MLVDTALVVGQAIPGVFFARLDVEVGDGAVVDDEVEDEGAVATIGVGHEVGEGAAFVVGRAMPSVLVAGGDGLLLREGLANGEVED